MALFGGVRWLLLRSGWVLLLARRFRGVLVGTPFDSQFAIGVAHRCPVFVIAIWHVSTLMVFFDPGVNMLHIESDGLTQAWDFLPKSGHCRLQEGLQQTAIQVAQLLTEPKATGKVFLGEKP